MSKEELFKAVAANQIRKVRQLLHAWKEPPLDGLRSGSGTPLLTAAVHASVAARAKESAQASGAGTELSSEMVWLLASWPGMNVNVRDGANMTPLHYAALFGDVSAVRELCKKGADLTLKDRTGFTALQLAAMHDQPKSFDPDFIPPTVKALFVHAVSEPSTSDSWPSHVKPSEVADCQALIHRGAGAAAKVKGAAQHWMNIVAAPAKPASREAPRTASGGLAL